MYFNFHVWHKLVLTVGKEEGNRYNDHHYCNLTDEETEHRKVKGLPRGHTADESKVKPNDKHTASCPLNDCLNIWPELP